MVFIPIDVFYKQIFELFLTVFSAEHGDYDLWTLQFVDHYHGYPVHMNIINHLNLSLNTIIRQVTNYDVVELERTGKKIL